MLTKDGSRRLGASSTDTGTDAGGARCHILQGFRGWQTLRRRYLALSVGCLRLARDAPLKKLPLTTILLFLPPVFKGIITDRGL